MKIFNLKNTLLAKLILALFVATTFLSTTQAIEPSYEYYPTTPNDYLLEAMDTGSTMLAHLALRNGATNINEALYWASCEGKIEVVRFLLNNGASPKAKLGEYGDPISRAAGSCRESTGCEVIALLLDRGAGVDDSNNDGYTALMEASAHFIPGSVELLLKRGADVNKRDKRGKSALDYARDKAKSYREIFLSKKKARPEIVARMILTFRILHEYGA